MFWVEDSMDFECSLAVEHTDSRNFFSKLEFIWLIEGPCVHNCTIQSIKRESKIKNSISWEESYIYIYVYVSYLCNTLHFILKTHFKDKKFREGSQRFKDFLKSHRQLELKKSHLSIIV